MIIICPHCSNEVDMPINRINRAKKANMKIYCSHTCSTLSQRKYKIKHKTYLIVKPFVGEEFRKYKDTNYSVSNYGRIINHINRRLLKCSKNPGGYFHKRFHNGNDIITISVHTMVAFAFIGPMPFGNIINHKNGIKTDNRVDNLEYCTQGENIKHAYDIGLRKIRLGENSSNSKFTSDDVILIRTLRFMYNVSTYPMLKKLFPDMSKATIHSIIKYKTWKHV